MRGEAPKDPLAAGQDDDLELQAGTRQDLEHLLYPPVVGEHQRVVEHDHRRPALIGQQLGKGEAGEDRDLLAGALAQALEGLAARRARATAVIRNPLSISSSAPGNSACR